MENIIEVVKERTGLNQAQIADAIEESHEMVSAWKRGTMPRANVAMKLMKLGKLSREEGEIIFKEKGFAEIGVLSGIAITSAMYLLAITQPAANPALAQLINSVDCILC